MERGLRGWALNLPLVDLKVKDAKAPIITNAEIKTHKTVILTFDEKIKAKEDEAITVITKKDNIQLSTAATAEIQADETSIKVTYASDLPEGSYEFTVSGITDQTENANGLTSEAPAVSEKVVKEKSELKTIKVLSEKIPAAKLDANDKPEKFLGEIKLATYDQYEGEMTINPTLASKVEIKAYAGTGENRVAVAIGKGDDDRTDNAKRTVTDGTIASKVYFSDADAASLTKGQTVTISVVGKTTDNKDKVYMEATPFNLVEYEEAAATYIDSIKLVSDTGDAITAQPAPAAASQLTTDKTYTLTVNWKDQYGNSLPAGNNTGENGADPTQAKWEIVGNSATVADLVKYYDDGSNIVAGNPVKSISSANGDKKTTAGDLPLKLVLNAKTPADAPLVLKVSRGTGEIQTFNFDVSTPALTNVDTDYASDTTNKYGFRPLATSGTATYGDASIAGAGLYTKEELTSYNIKPTVAGAELNPDDLKWVVTAVDNDDATKAIDLTTAENAPTVSIVKAKKLDASSKETTEDDPNRLQLKLTPAVEGSYTVKLYKKDADTENEQPILTLTTGAVTKNPTIAKIELLDTFAANEITSGGKSGFKKVAFTNVNGESIDVSSDATGETPTTDGLSVINKTGTIQNGSVTFHGEGADGKPVEAAAGIGTPIKYIRVATNASDNTGAGQFALQGKGKYGSKFLTVDIDVVAAATIQTVAFTKTESSVQPIIDDTTVADPDTATKFKVVNVGTDAYTLVPVSFVNQYDGAMDVKTTGTTDITLNGVKVTLGEATNEVKGDTTDGVATVATDYSAGFFDKNGAAIKAAGTDVAYIGIHATTNADEAGLDLTMTAKDAAGNDVTDTIHVSPQKARTVKTITLDKTTATLSPGASIYFKLDAKDQYGKAIAVNTKVNISALNMDGIDAKLGSRTIDAVAAASSDGYKVEYYADNSGKPADSAYTTSNDGVAIKYIKVIADATTVPTAGTTLTLTKTGETTPLVSAAIDFVGTDDIKSIKLENEVTATTSGEDTGVYKNGTIYAKHADTTANTYTIPLKAFDENGKAIDVADAFYKGQDGSTEPVVTVKDKDGQPKSYTTASATVSKSAITLTLTGNGSADKIVKDDTVEIVVTSKNFRTAKLTLKVDTTQPALATDINVINATNTALQDDSGAYPAVSADGVSAYTTYTDTATQKAVTTATKLAVQGVDQYGVLRNTIEDKTVIENGTPIYYSDTKAVANVLSNGTLIPMANGTATVRVIRAGVETTVKVNVPDGMSAKPAETAGTFSSNNVTVPGASDTNKKYVLVEAKTGSSNTQTGVNITGATFSITSASAGTYYLFEADTNGNITSYAATVNVTSA